MAERGGQAAADGFQYQYLVTLEALLDAVEDRFPGVASALIEPALTPDGDATDPDAIDFELVSHDRLSVRAVQVKSGGTGTEMSGPEAFGILLRMVRARPRAQTYQLITNMRLHPKTVQLNLALALDDPQKVRAQLRQLMERSRRWHHEPAALSDDEVDRLRHARVVVDGRERFELREQLRERMRRIRNEHRSGLGYESAGRLTNYLAFEIFRRASGEFSGVFSLGEFREELLTSSRYLAYELGAFDWGIMVGAVPAPPDIPRPDLVSRIRTSLADSSGERIVARCALLGPSGIGKTSIAAAYAHDVADSYDHIFWVNGENGASIRASFQGIHDVLPHTDMGAAADSSRLRTRVRALLSASPRPWLMIIDNVVDHEILQPWVPTSGRGHVIITSTNQAKWATHRAKVVVQSMTPDQATALIRMRMCQDDEWDSHSEQTASGLAERLEYWPLAIELACGHLAGGEFGLNEAARYLEQIRDWALDDTSSIPDGYPHTLVGAIRLALRRLLDKGDEQPACAGAANALFPAAYFASRQIPIWLLYFSTLMSPEDATRVGLRHPAVLDATARVPFTVVDMHRALRTESLAQRDESLCALPPQEWSAVHREGVDDTISVNEIVQHVIRTLAERGSGVSGILSQAAYHAQSWLTSFNEADDETHLLAVLPHVQSLADHARRLGIATDVLAVMWGNLAGIYVALGELAEAQAALENELAHLLARPEPAPLLELKTRTQLADVLSNTGGPATVWLQHLHHARDLARQLAESRPQDVSVVVANCLTVLLNQIRRGSASAELQGLVNDFEALHQQLPHTPRSHAQREIGRINAALSSENLTNEEVEQRCRTLLDSGDLSRPQSLQVTAFLTEALAFQHRWNAALEQLQIIHEYMIEWPLHPQLTARTLHNVGLRVGLAVASGEPECRAACIALVGGAEPSPVPECRPLLSLLVTMASRMPAEYLSLEAGMTCMPYKLQTLCLLEAVCDQDHDRIRAIYRSMADLDTDALTQDHEIGWRTLSNIVTASSVSMMLGGS
ncbi:NB-ARC domain-containing protein [Streptoverticillium reticulum]|uniref:NB-ARC domain-containing protein n=1 Tax=Streptoverticillium reticulum TaxID=1433415 RepID=UPI0039BFEC84